MGISTRGRDTGDAQLFVNLVDNFRLDHDYTIIGRVSSGLDVARQVLYVGTPSWRAYFKEYALVTLGALGVAALILLALPASWMTTSQRAIGVAVAIGLAALVYVGLWIWRRSAVVRVTTTNIETESGLFSKKIDVLNPECIGCLDCVAVCPVKDALGLRVKSRRLSPTAYAAAVLLLFFAGYFGARTFGLWENGISDAEYVQRIREDGSVPYGHPGM